MIALVSSDPWLTVGIALIAAVAALSGALIAAVTAGRRQRAQLQADAERQRTELRHERMLAELAELRGVLDDAARDITDGERAMLNATSAWIADGTVSDALRDALQGKVDAMWGSAQRIRIRLGSDEIREAYWTATQLQLQLLGQVWNDGTDLDQQARAEAVVEPRAGFLRNRDAFFERAHEKYGSKGLGGEGL
jgi:type II secretory pathway pseudopilin PulG